MQKASPIPDTTPQSGHESDSDLQHLNVFARTWLRCWRKIKRFFNKRKPNRNKSPQDIMDAAKQRFGIDIYDIVGSVVGSTGDGKSSLTNRLCNSTDKGASAAPTDVVECTTEPSAYYKDDCPRFKVLDNPGIGTRDQGIDFDKYAEKHLLEVADFFLGVTGNRIHHFFPDFQAWCQKRGKPFAVVRTRAHNDVDTLMDTHDVDEKTAFRMLKSKMYDDLRKNGMDDVKLFLVDNKLWQKAIIALERGNYKQAGTRYDEDKLIRFVARASFARYPASELLKIFSRASNEECEAESECESDNDSDASRYDVKPASPDATEGKSTDLSSIHSAEFQTKAQNRCSRGPTDFPSVF